MTTAAPTQEIRKYELMVIFSGDLSEADLEKEIDELRKTLKEDTQGVTYEDSWGKRDLAYKIKRQSRGYYVVFNFAATPHAILELRSGVKLNHHILRHLLVSVGDDYEPGRQDKDLTRLDESMERRPRIPSASSSERKVEMVKEAAAKKVLVEEEAEEKQKKKPVLAGKEEEDQLKTVEKRLEKILENPDIDIR
ncbi:30S ribosomal protein S6 [Candidatus Peregrinibacteria bacterium]|nr:30S ribosomal protein S6 [Candidatus Peregrinibacteria bacterium]